MSVTARINAGLEVLETAEAVRNWTRAHHAAGRTVGFVPTMGYLHEGHTSLMVEAGRHCDVILASIFVNPTQFGPNEDLDSYPRDPEGDLRKAAGAGCSAVFMPSVEEMYPDGATTTVDSPILGQYLCGASRPGHFSGVCTVVLKLFNITQCDVAVFGQKDFQQLAIIRQMVSDLNLPVKIIGAPIVREADGIAMSSRNVRLSPEARREALALSESLATAEAAWKDGVRDADALRAIITTRIEAAAGAEVDYIELCDPVFLSPVSGPQETVLIALAVRFGPVRLIDNRVLGA
jgi:pantoate--beta-alanine ligase